MKSKTVSMRIEAVDRQAFGKAASEHKNLSAFLLSAARRAVKYRRLIEQAEILSKDYTVSKLEVSVKP